MDHETPPPDIDDHDELRSVLASSFAANGWDEPDMDVYDLLPPKVGEQCQPCGND